MRSPSIPTTPPAANPAQAASFGRSQASLISPAASTPLVTPLTGVATLNPLAPRGGRPSLLGSTQ